MRHHQPHEQPHQPEQNAQVRPADRHEMRQTYLAKRIVDGAGLGCPVAEQQRLQQRHAALLRFTHLVVITVDHAQAQRIARAGRHRMTNAIDHLPQVGALIGFGEKLPVAAVAQRQSADHALRRPASACSSSRRDSSAHQSRPANPWHGCAGRREDDGRPRRDASAVCPRHERARRGARSNRRTTQTAWRGRHN